MHRIHVNLPNAPHDILVGFDTLRSIGMELAKLDLGESVFVISSPRIAKLYEKPLLAGLRRGGFRDVEVFHLPDGERNKNMAQWEKILTRIAKFDKGEARRFFVVNLGGGVVGDLGGFVAGAYHRGTPYVQVPTTLLACVDCGLGGKVGVNLGKFKNCVGMFWQPRLVFADLSLLKTLNKRELKSGLAEVIKYGASLKKPLFSFLEKHWEDIVTTRKEVLLEISRECYKIKTDIIVKDAGDSKNIRVVLNYGHTIGHAVESASGYSYRHGESVSIGMVCANDIAVRLGMLNQAVADRIERLIQKVGLPTRIKSCRLDDILSAMANDKKFVNGRNRFVLLEDIGKTKIVEQINRRTIKQVIRKRSVQA